MKKSVIVISGPSGGTGKSTICKELGLIFSELIPPKLKVCVIDLDLSNGGQSSLFRILPYKNIMDWIADYRTEKGASLQALDQIYTWNKIQEYLTVPPSHSIYILAAPADGKFHELEIDELEMVLYYLRKHFDVILIDTGNNLDSPTQSAYACSDQILLVATDDVSVLNNIKKLRRFIRCKGWGIEHFFLILNRYASKPGHNIYTPKEIEDTLYFEIKSILPEEKDLWMLNNAGISVALDGQMAVDLRRRLIDLATCLSK